ncbi:unnamed protein product [Caenorhabditis sp. 36 PRJEB53466]|nr:unnamed protein product [Caenorhabditis sp. 36 PRJEB53466]
MVCGVGWIGAESIISAADDHNFILTNTATNEAQQILSMQNSFFPTNGSGLLTCGEDGYVKMWSRSGMLRSVLAQFATAYEIVELTVNQCGPLNDRNVAFRDHTGAVYVAMIKTFGVSQRVAKIGSLVEQLVFNDVTNMLCGISEGKIVVWPLPNIAFLDRNLLQKSIIQKSIGNVGKFPQLANFAGNTIVIRKSDGCLLPTGVAPFYGTAISMASHSKWDQAIRLCRSIHNDTLWATFAGLSILHKNMIAMEIAYAALEDDEKVALINEIKEKSDKDVRQALQVVLTGKVADADVLLERNGQSFRSLMLNVQMFKWKRALELAVKNKQWLEIVIGYREKYLKNCGLKETDPQFLKHRSEVEVDWIHIRELIAAERAKGTY